jgi:hypothetical protein
MPQRVRSCRKPKKSDAYRLVVDEAALDAATAAHRMFGKMPWWVRALMAARNSLMAPFGLKTGREMSSARTPEAATARWAAGAAGGTRPAGTTARLARPSGACHRWLGEKAFTLGLLARQLAGPAHGLGLLADALLGRLLVVLPLLHLAEDALALHLLL